MKALALTLLTLSAATWTANAAATLTFDSDTQGIVFANFGQTGSVTHSAVNGGSVQIENTQGGFGWIAKLFMNGNQSAAVDAVYDELVAAITVGGTISYDVIVTPTSVSGAAPGFAQANFFADNQQGPTFFDSEFDNPVYGGGTLPVAMNTVQQISIDVQTSGTKANNDDLAYFIGNTGNIQLGFGSNYNTSTGFTYYIDNLTVTAVPEPSTLLSLSLASLLFLRRRRN